MIPLPLYREIQLAIEGMEGWCDFAKAADLADLICVNRPGIVVELGVFGGKSLVPMGLALRHNASTLHSRSGVAYGIDPWKIGPAIEGDVGKENSDWWQNKVDLHHIHKLCTEKIWSEHLDTHVVILRTTAEMALPLFRDGSVDLLHQDSNHSELVSCRQAQAWAPKIAHNGWWVLDDADWTTQRAVVELIPTLGFIRRTGTDKYLVFQRRSVKVTTSP